MAKITNTSVVCTVDANLSAQCKRHNLSVCSAHLPVDHNNTPSRESI